MPAGGGSNRSQASVVGKQGKGKEKESTEEDAAFKKKQADEKKALQAAAKGMAGKKK